MKLCVAIATVGLALVHGASHVASLRKCVHRCEAKNECRASLDSLACESSCETQCACAAIKHRMLNKPKHCTASMLEKHRNLLGLVRMKKSMQKVVLKDTDEQPEFQSFVPLADYWRHGQTSEEQEQVEKKPFMLNNAKQMSLLKAGVQPWSAAARSPHHHHRKPAKKLSLLPKKVAVLKQEMSIVLQTPPAPKTALKEPVLAAKATEEGKIRAKSTKSVATANASKVAPSQPAALAKASSAQAATTTAAPAKAALAQSHATSASAHKAPVKAIPAKVVTAKETPTKSLGPKA